MLPVCIYSLRTLSSGGKEGMGMAVFETFFYIGASLSLGIVVFGVLPASFIIKKTFKI